VYYASRVAFDALEATVTDGSPDVDRLTSARDRARRAIGAGIVQGDVTVTIACDAAGAVSVAISPSA
jgi:hypothetical protein